MEPRNQFLHPPDPGRRLVVNPLKLQKARAELHKAFDILEGVASPYKEQLLWSEAANSSFIKGEFHASKIISNYAAIEFLLDAISAPRDLRDAHRILMTGESQTTPGRYRDIQVYVGHRAASSEYRGGLDAGTESVRS